MRDPITEALRAAGLSEDDEKAFVAGWEARGARADEKAYGRGWADRDDLVRSEVAEVAASLRSDADAALQDARAQLAESKATYERLAAQAVESRAEHDRLAADYRDRAASVDYRAVLVAQREEAVARRESAARVAGMRAEDERTCSECERSLAGRRPQTLTCSDRCRTALHERLAREAEKASQGA